MHILEIIEPHIQTVRSNTPSNELGRDTKSPSYIDSGNFSVVHQDEDPHMVSKTARGAKESRIDGYWVFVDYVLRYKLWENPYFPRIYGKKTTTHTQNNASIKNVTMEKLHSHNTLSEEEGIFLYKKMFGENIDKFDVEDLGMRIEEEVGTGKASGNAKSYDKNYIKAIRILHNISKKEKTYIDIWEENLMYRRGRYGVQLVITDPFAHKND